MNHISISLVTEPIWEKFDAIGTEMIINKVGRKMFPKLEYAFKGLHPDGRYKITLKLVRVDENRWKYCGRWMPASRGEQFPMETIALPYGEREDRFYIGSDLMKEVLVFDGFKMTNNNEQAKGRLDMFHVLSMHKYVPVLTIQQQQDYPNVLVPVAVYRNPKTTFIAVTCYQNDEVTKMKVSQNPFAKGFRDKSGRKRASYSPSTEDGQSPAKFSNTSSEDAGLHAEDEHQLSPSWGQIPGGHNHLTRIPSPPMDPMPSQPMMHWPAQMIDPYAPYQYAPPFYGINNFVPMPFQMQNWQLANQFHQPAAHPVPGWPQHQSPPTNPSDSKFHSL